MIRFIKETEINQLIDLCEKHATYEKAPYDRKGKKAGLLKALFSEQPALYCLVATENEKIVGYATYMLQYSTWDAKYYTYLDCLFLLEEARGKGTGLHLMQSVRAESLKLNSNLIQWQTPDFNVDAIRFYKRLGAFSKTKERFLWEVETNH